MFPEVEPWELPTQPEMPKTTGDSKVCHQQKKAQGHPKAIKKERSLYSVLSLVQDLSKTKVPAKKRIFTFDDKQVELQVIELSKKHERETLSKPSKAKKAKSSSSSSRGRSKSPKSTKKSTDGRSFLSYMPQLPLLFLPVNE